MIRIAIILAAAISAILVALGHGACLESVAVKHGKKFGQPDTGEYRAGATVSDSTLFGQGQKLIK